MLSLWANLRYIDFHIVVISNSNPRTRSSTLFSKINQKSLSIDIKALLNYYEKMRIFTAVCEFNGNVKGNIQIGIPSMFWSFYTRCETPEGLEKLIKFAANDFRVVSLIVSLFLLLKELVFCICLE